MCINPIHNNKGILHHSNNVTSDLMWASSSCAMDTLYDLDLISNKVPVILDNSKFWFQVMSTSMKLGSRGVAHVEGVTRSDLEEKKHYSKILLLNRAATGWRLVGSSSAHRMKTKYLRVLPMSASLKDISTVISRMPHLQVFC